MSTVGTARPPDCVAEAATALAEQDPPSLAAIVLRRLEGEDVRELPSPVKDEEPRSIFVEVARSNQRVAESLRRALSDLIESLADEPRFEKPEVVADVCYLCAALGATTATDGLRKLVSREDTASVHMKDCEDLRLRALRSLVGLLGWRPPSHPDAHLKQLFEGLLGQPRYELLSLTALVGLWPDQRGEFIARSTAGHSADRSLATSLRWAGFDRDPKAKRPTGHQTSE